MHKAEPRIIKEFLESNDDVGFLGKHIKQTNSRFERIEQSHNELSSNEVNIAQNILQICNKLEKIKKSMDEINSRHKNYVMENAAELTNIKENIVSKSEFSEFIEGMKNSISEKQYKRNVSAFICTSTRTYNSHSALTGS